MGGTWASFPTNSLTLPKGHDTGIEEEIILKEEKTTNIPN